MIRGVILSKLVGPLCRTTRYKPVSRYFVVDNKKIEALKRQHTGYDVPFVSTNDLISSWFHANCLAEHGLLALNFRGRLKGHTEDHAGNYGNVLYFRLPQDANTPTLIRKTLSALQRVVTRNEPIRSSSMMWQNFGICTNWTSFISKHMDLPGCKQLVHLPVYNIEALLPSTLSMCLIFQARPNQLAILMGGTSQNWQALSSAPFESEVAFSTTG